MTVAATGLPVSIQTRLVRHAKAIGMEPNHVLARYAAERFLYRLSRSPHAGRFVLKGALLMLVWLGETIRPTRDVDLLGSGELSEKSLARIMADVCATEVEPDGLEYLPETSIAEKLHAMVALGDANSRMRDFFDIDALAQHRSFEGSLLASAVRATFERRRTPIPEAMPRALTPGFAARDKQLQWQAFKQKNGLTSAPAELGTVVARLATFLQPVVDAARGDLPLALKWSPGGPWQAA